MEVRVRVLKVAVEGVWASVEAGLRGCLGAVDSPVGDD